MTDQVTSPVIRSVAPELDDHLPRIGMILEQSLGHVSHGRNLQRSIEDTVRAQLRFREIPYAPEGVLDRIPPRSNWTVRSGLRAKAAVKEMHRSRPLDALFVHTQVPATMLGSAIDKIPTVVSLDATPIQIDELGASYGHRVLPGPLERAKTAAQRSVFQRASHLICWSDWAAGSLVDDYGVDPATIDVIAPGVLLDQWQAGTRPPFDPTTVRILFVGGDFERKGGTTLLDAVDRLNHDPDVIASGVTIELHLVTTSPGVTAGPGRFVYNHLTPNAPELIDLYRRCDVFALPTRGDCSPLVLAEAAASGLAAVTTDVGAIRETVIDQTTGHLVSPTVDAVADALRQLVLDPDHRRSLGEAARAHATRSLDANANAHLILDRLIEVSSRTVRSPQTWLTVSGNIKPEIEAEIAAGERPLADYVAIGNACGADLIDRDRVSSDGSRTTRLIQRVAGADVAMAWHIHRNRAAIDVVITDGEQVGMPLALMLSLGGRRGLRHVMIGHRLTPPKKTIPIRALGLGRGVDEILVYASPQLNVAQQLFARPWHRVRLIDFMVDTEFFTPAAQRPDPNPRPLISAAGLEFRDYQTLIDAVRDLDVDVVIASASPWSKRDDETEGVELPDNVTVSSFSQAGLRDLFDRADIAAVPLVPTDFQAGITTILEAMSMELPVVCTATVGQIDVISDGQEGLYVPPSDVRQMRAALQQLIDDPARAQAMGRRGRSLVVKRADVRAYANLFAEIVDGHLPRSNQPNTDPIGRAS